MSNSLPRVLYIAHGHPDINKGGAEIAAFNLYNSYREQGGDAYFIGRTALHPHGGAAFSSRNGKRELLFHTTMDDGFLFSNIKTKHLWGEFAQLLQLIKPDVVHLHHYFQLGVEILTVIRNTLPDCRIVLTLHEYLAICPLRGMMVKRNGSLCYEANPRDCSQCLADTDDKQPGDIFLRERYIKNHFAHVDAFVSPSAFLKQRYVDWGLDESSITVIENGQPNSDEAKQHSFKGDVLRLAFFGQLNPQKGVDILLEAVGLLSRDTRKRVHIEIHGANLESQEYDFQEHIEALLKKYKATVTFCGPYESREQGRIMESVDWVVVPSTWWENSPMVIQEAFAHGKPVLCSDIGGMAEKVEHLKTGLHFRVKNSVDLARQIEHIVAEPQLTEQLRSHIKPPLNLQQALHAHLPLYATN